MIDISLNHKLTRAFSSSTGQCERIGCSGFRMWTSRAALTFWSSRRSACISRSCMVDDMHWKAIKYLTSNYKIIIYPDFRTKGMMKKLSKSNKRKIAALSFYKFKQRLIYKCKAEGCSLIIMNEAYTSRTCSCCGFLNPKSTSKAFECKSCKWAVDRDLNGARNIMLKTLCCLSSI